MSIQVTVQVICNADTLPSMASFEQWCQQAAEEAQHAIDNHITVRIIDEQESAHLNLQFRQKPGPTNVLSFPYPPFDADDRTLGDIAICAQLVRSEAAQQQIDEEAHWAHLTIHGMLHLLGYDHIDPADATIMEQLEAQTLQLLGYNNPYER